MSRNRPAFLRQSSEPRPVVNPSFSVERGDWIRVDGQFRQVAVVFNAQTDKEAYELCNGNHVRERVTRADDVLYGRRW
jgi:hypothetical protein